MKEVELIAIIPSVIGDTYTCYLLCRSSMTLLPAKLSKKACSIVLEARNCESSRSPAGLSPISSIIFPNVYETLKRLVVSVGGVLDSVLIYKSHGDVFYSYIRVIPGGQQGVLTEGVQDVQSRAESSVTGRTVKESIDTSYGTTYDNVASDVPDMLGERLDINATFVDALCVSIVAGCPLYVSDEVLNKEGIKVTRDLLSRSVI